MCTSCIFATVCEYWVNAVFSMFAFLVNVLQTRYLISVQTWAKSSKHGVLPHICFSCKSILSWSKAVFYLHIYCKSKVVTNMYIFLTSATGCKYWVNAVFTIFTFYVNLVQTLTFVLSKYDQLWYFLHICYYFATFVNPFLGAVRSLSLSLSRGILGNFRNNFLFLEYFCPNNVVNQNTDTLFVRTSFTEKLSTT